MLLLGSHFLTRLLTLLRVRGFINTFVNETGIPKPATTPAPNREVGSVEFNVEEKIYLFRGYFATNCLKASSLLLSVKFRSSTRMDASPASNNWVRVSPSSSASNAADRGLI